MLFCFYKEANNKKIFMKHYSFEDEEQKFQNDIKDALQSALTSNDNISSVITEINTIRISKNKRFVDCIKVLKQFFFFKKSQ